MHAIFEEAGKFLGGRILSEAESSAQIELESGKRVKAKLPHIVLRFEQPTPAQLLAGAQQESGQIDLDLAWEFASEEEFGFADLAREYYGNSCTLTQTAAMLLRLHEAPHYFRRSGKGRFRRADAEVLRLALAAIEKKKQVQLKIDRWTEQLIQGTCPDEIRSLIFKVLFKPDKNSAEYKSVVQAARASQRAPLDLLQRAGAIGSAYEFHWQRFLFDNFPKGTDFPAIIPPQVGMDLPLSEATAYSIDDSETTEIDDALSVQGLGTGTVTLGIHIAAPGLAVTPGDAIDTLGRQRLSTVYMPGHKITMLPDDVVQGYTLAEGQACPAVSLYVRMREQGFEILDHQTRLERVTIGANLRHDQLDTGVTPEWLQNPDTPWAGNGPEPAMPRCAMAWLWRLTTHLKQAREQVRGKPENFSRPDYTFRLIDKSTAAPTGEERVEIGVRRRGAPLDLIVAEAMILANSTWGQWMSTLGVPAIYRSQASLAPGVKVRMGTKALPHAGIGVPSYAWSTSPLRRYTDLVNQWQIIACARHGATAALAAPFQPKSAELFSIISSFETAYSAYNGHQSQMERFWTLRYLRQHDIGTLDATVIKAWPDQPAVVRADTLPLVLSVTAAGLQRGQRVRLQLGEIDDIGLDISATVLELLGDDQTLSTESIEESEADLTAAGPISVDMDLTAAEPTATDDDAA
ncbi:MAG: RNB domain-containing ribonuclease [Alphaproteobacteria bacterium]|nr:RNB domain-containing ribonuclease [Alphaproteobacteria bacterium]